MTLDEQIQAFLDERRRENVSPHTLRGYGSDLAQFSEYFTELGGPPARWTTLALRGWLAWLHARKLSAVSLRRKLAAVRSFFQFLLRRGETDINVAKLLRTPKAPKLLPRVMTEEQAGALLDGVAQQDFEKPFPERDRALFELLYGSGLRISEAVGLTLDDLDLAEGWMLVRGKGKKERQVPLAGAAFEAITRYIGVRQAVADERGLFTNFRGKRLSDRGARGIIRFYAYTLTNDPSIHPHSFRHAYATHLLIAGADLRAIQELLGHARLSTTQKYTQLALQDLMAVYDKAHPRA